MVDVVTLTMNPSVDRSCDAERVVGERKIRCGPPRREPGGGGINVARAMKRLGEEARAVDDGRAEVVLASFGAGGALLVSDEATERIPSPTVPISSRVGAGDSMVAGVVCGLVRGLGPREAARFGVAAGAAAVKTPGLELCRRADAEELCEEIEG